MTKIKLSHRNLYLPVGVLLVLLNILSVQVLAQSAAKKKPFPLPSEIKQNTNNTGFGCGFDYLMKLNRATSGYAAKEALMNEQIRNVIASKGPNDTITLPIVIHIIHNNPNSITDATIVNAVKDLNDAFSKSGIYSASTGVDTKIRFCLAHIDPNGGVTSGITRNTSFFSVSMNGEIEDSKLKNLIQWPPDSYVNIWYIQSMEKIISVDFLCGSWSISKAGGYATFPPGGSPVDGIVVTAFGSMLAHEMGHYLFLYHTFEGGCKNSDCSTDGDKVCDTPPDNLTSNSPSCNLPDNSCFTDSLSGFAHDQNDLIANFMDYGNTSCKNNFTQGQTDRMRNAILTMRTGLLQPKCDVTCITNATAYFTRNINYPIAGDSVRFTNLSANATAYKWYVNDVLMGTSINFGYRFNQVGKYKIALKSYVGTDTCFASYIGYVIVNCGVTARFYPNTNEIASKLPDFPDSIFFRNTSVGANQYEWYVSNNVGMPSTMVSTSVNLSYIFPTPGIYFVKLVARNGACADSTFEQMITVDDPTPDGTAYLVNLECYRDSGVRFQLMVCNSGYAAIKANTPVSFYENSPYGSNGHLLATYKIPNDVLGKCCYQFPVYALFYNHTGFKNIYVVFNDTGQLITPINLPNTLIKESDYSNNVKYYSNKYTVGISPSAVNTALPFDVVTLKGQANEPTSSYTWSPSKNLSCTICQSTNLTIDSNRVKQVIGLSNWGCRDTTKVVITVPPHNDFIVKIQSAKCVNQDSIDIRFKIQNNFLKGYILKNIRVAFYNSDPRFNGAVLLSPIFVVPIQLNSNTANYTIKVRNMPRGILWAVVNDSATKIPIHLPSTTFTETNYSNNIDSLSYDPATYSYFNPVICTGQNYLGYNNTGVYRDTFVAASGCDSVMVTNLTVKPRSYNTINKTICIGNSYLGYNVSGKFYDTLVAANGCDSVRILNLFVAPRTTSNNANSICEGEIYWGYTTSGIYTDTLVNANGCDSFRVLNLTVKPRSHYTIADTICDGESFLGHQTTGIYYDTLVGANTCDSVIKINLTVNPSPHPFLGLDRELCYVDSTHLFAGNFKSYMWSTGAITPNILIKKYGTYWLIVTNEYDCVNGDTINIIPRFCNNFIVPNVFSPNGDNINDTWVINALKFFVNPTVSIFDRSGNPIYKSRGYNIPWDGTYNKKKVPLGVYYYIIELTDVKQTISGSVTVLY